MHKNLSKILIKAFIGFSLCSILFISSTHARSVAAPGLKDKRTAVNGVLDLTDWDWQQDGILPLNGQWEFYWHTLLTPDDFKDEEPILNRNLITLPRAWNKYEINRRKLTGAGYATFRLLIRHSTDQILGIKIPRIFTSYRLWANGELLSSVGQVAVDKDNATPQYLTTVKYLKPETNPLELVVQVSNFRHRSGGMLESLQIGPASEISRIQVNNLTLEMFLFGSLFIIGCYHLALFLFRTKDRSALYFGVYCLLISMRTLLVGEIFLIQLIPDFNWEIAHKGQTLAFYLGVPLFIMFLKAVFPQETSKRINLFIQVFGISFGLLVLLTPARIFTHFNPIYQVFSLMVILYSTFIIILACYKRREGCYIIGFGVLILFLFAINDIIFLSIILADSDNHFLREIVTRGDLSSLGLLVFAFTQSAVLAKKFSKSFSRVEMLTEELQETNANLEEKVKERTEALERSKEKLKEAYQAVTRSEKSLQDLMQNISHDLRTPLSAIKGYVNAILDGIVKEPQQQKKYLSRVQDQVNHVNSMVQELFDLSQLESRQLKFHLTMVPLPTLAETFYEKYSLERAKKNLHFQVVYPDCWLNNTSKEAGLFLQVDLEKLERVLTNLLNNAFKFTKDGDQIELSFALTADGKDLLIKVSDTGVGISPHDLPHIFDRFYMVSPARRGAKQGSGLGLAIVKEIVEYHSGRIWAESELGQGSQFFIVLPVHSKQLHDPESA